MHAPHVDSARVDLDRVLSLRIRGELEVLAQVGHQVAHLAVAHVGWRAAAEVQLFDLAHAGEQAALHVDFLLQVAEVGGGLGVVLGDDLVAAAVVADGVAERDVDVQRQGPLAAAHAQAGHRLQELAVAEVRLEAVGRRIRGVARAGLAQLADDGGVEFDVREGAAGVVVCGVHVQAASRFMVCGWRAGARIGRTLRLLPNLNRLTACVRPPASSARLAVAAAASSTSAAFCCVTWSMWAMAALTWSTPMLCSREAVEISCMMMVTCLAEPTTCSMVAPALRALTMPALTLPTEASISCLMSLAALALRWARLRTSPATTAKPRPCSPARAASTAAFSARMLVWKAIPSIRPMMSTILREEALISSMVAMTAATISPPCTATLEAFCASWLAWAELSAFCLTVAENCSTLEAVSSRLAACASVRPDRSALPAAIWRVATAMVSTLVRTSRMVAIRLLFICCKARSSWPTSSVASVSNEQDRSPAAIERAPCKARSSGLSTEERMVYHRKTLISRPAKVVPKMA